MQPKFEELVHTFIEEYEGGCDELKKERYKNALILLSKATFALCDIIIFKKINNLPKNHSERFRILEQYFPEIYSIIDKLFSYYINAYSKPVLKENCMEIKNGITKIAKDRELPEKIKEITG